MEIKYIGVHHFGGTLTLKEVSNIHRSRWPDFPSKLRPDLYVGYNIIVWKDGTYTQCRYVGEETAAQLNHNKDTVSIALDGDFSQGKSKPTFAQQDALRALMRGLLAGDASKLNLSVIPGTTLNIAPERILPHRILQPNHTECYGYGLTDSWARDLIKATVPESHASSVPVLPPPPPQSNGPALTVWKQLAELMIRYYQALLLAQKPVLGRKHVHMCIDNVRG